MGEPAAAAPGLEAPPATVDDVVWLPPAPPSGSAERLALAARLAGAGVPVVLQVLVPTGGSVEGESARSTPSPRRAAGEPAAKPSTAPSAGSGEAAETRLPTPPFGSGHASSGAESLQDLARLPGSGVVTLLDPLPVLLTEGAEAATSATVRFAGAVPGAAVVWPLIPGFELGDAAARATAEALAAAGVSALQPMVLRLSAAQRRRLAEGRGAEVFDALFHGPSPDERRFARAAAAAGFAPFLPRPLPRPPLAGAETRRLAGLLALAGELWVRCGRAPAAGQALFRAARWADDAGYDLGALAREGNLGVIAALDERSRALITEAADGGTPALVRELLDEYTAPEDAGAGAAGEPAVATVSEEVGNG